MRNLVCVFLVLFTCRTVIAENVAVDVITIRVPDDGIQPQLAVGSDGKIHMVYYRGEGAAGDLHYVTSTDQGETFSPAIRVNSQDQSAIAAGTIRGAHLALGANDGVHVAWNGSGKASPKGLANPDLPADSPHRHSAPMLYARMNTQGTAFEPERNLMTHTYSLDGGGSVAADTAGNVFVVWHANSVKEKARGEAGRSVWVAASQDNGKTFTSERKANAYPTGACGCCGLRAHADGQGNLFVLYRTAAGSFNRDMQVLVSKDHGETFDATLLDKWQIGKCVMSSGGIYVKNDSVFAAWETEQQVKFARIDNLSPLSKPVAVIPESGKESRKHPVIVANAGGQALLVWTEGTGWNRGGNVAWQVFDKSGRPIAGTAGNVKGVPVWGFAAAFSRPDGRFTIVY